MSEIQLPLRPADQRDRIARLLSGQKRVLEMVALGEPLDEILHAITALIESEGDGILCTILLLDDSGKHLFTASALSLPAAYNEAIDGSPIGPRAGSCGTAAYLGRRVIVEDIATDPLWDDYRELALPHGLRACWSEPILSRDNVVLGTFAIYHARPACPTPQHLELIETAAHLAGIALERQHSADALCRAKEIAENANASKDQFLAVLSHELRTPLTPVLATVNLLEARGDQLPPDVRADLATIRRNIEMEARLIDDLLDLTRISRGKIELQCDVVDVHEVLHSALEICQSDLDAKHQHLTLGLWATRHHAWADRSRLQQVFWNLLSNAIKFTPKGGRITLTTENPRPLGDPSVSDDSIAAGGGAGSLLVRVSDTGIGIDPEVLPKLFTAFEQGQRLITRQFGGLGLGLAISKALVELHAGTLAAASEGQGHGAVFSVVLPVTQRAVSRTDEQPALLSDRPAGGGPLILLVEDHADTLRVMTRLLSGTLGYTVTGATSVADAIELLDKQRFDLLISDLGLPDGSGLDIMRRVRQRQQSGGQPLRSIALSGFGMEEDIRRSAEAGFDRHLTKPVDVDLLDRTLRDLTT